jgi:hypothetical protein
LASPTFTGTVNVSGTANFTASPTGPTDVNDTSSNNLATRADVRGAIITLDGTIVKVSGAQSIAGAKTFTDTVTAPIFRGPGSTYFVVGSTQAATEITGTTNNQNHIFYYTTSAINTINNGQTTGALNIACGAVKTGGAINISNTNNTSGFSININTGASNASTTNINTGATSTGTTNIGRGSAIQIVNGATTSITMNGSTNFTASPTGPTNINDTSSNNLATRADVRGAFINSIVSGTTDAESTSTGALQVAGGVGVAKSLFVGTNLNVSGSSTVTGNVIINGTTDAASTSTGALQVAGGVGVAKSLFVGTTSNMVGDVSMNSKLFVASDVSFNTNLNVGGSIVNSALTNSLAAKAPLASPELTGTPTAPTAAVATNSTQIATTAFVVGEINALINGAGPALNTLNELATALGNDAAFSTTVTNSLAAKAPLASPTFTGTVTIPTGASITAPTGLVKGDVGLGSVDNTSDANKPVSTATTTALNLKANIANPTFTGTVTGGEFIGTSFQPTAVETAITFGNNITTGNIDIGASQTTGNLNLGAGLRNATGNIFLGTGSTATNTINIGRGNTIAIVNSETPTLTINRPIILTSGSAAIQSAGVNAIGFYATPIVSSNIPKGATSGSNSITGTGISVSGSGVFSINYRCSINSTNSIASTVIVCGVSLATGSSNNESTALLGSCWKDDESRTISSGEYIRSGSFIINQTATSTYYPFCKINYSGTPNFTHSFSITAVKIA